MVKSNQITDVVFAFVSSIFRLTSLEFEEELNLLWKREIVIVAWIE